MYTLLGSSAVLLGSVVFYIFIDDFMVGYQIRDFNLTERLMTQSIVLMTYMKMILLPSLSDMTFYHDYFQTVRILDQHIVIACLLICTLLVVSVVSVGRAPLVSFGVLFLWLHSS